MKNTSAKSTVTKTSTVKSILDALHKLVFRSSLTFSLLSLIIAFISAKQQLGINGNAYISLAVFSVLTAISFLVTDVLKKHSINNVLTTSVNFILCYLSFTVLFYLLKDMLATTSFNSTVASFIYLSIVFVGVYFVIAAIKLIAGMVKNSLLQNGEEYNQLYK